MPEFLTNVWGIAVALFILAFSIFIHELGHFLAARKRGLKIERFSIGFGPKLYSWTRNGVEYRLSLLPFGGYVALPQMADMGMIEGNTESDKDKLPPISYSDKMIVSVMGAVFNILLAFAVSIIIWQAGWPRTELEQTTTIGAVYETIQIDDDTIVPGPAWEAGMQPGDKILTIDGKPVADFTDIIMAIHTGGKDDEGRRTATITYERKGEEHTVTMNPVITMENERSKDERRRIGIEPAYPISVSRVFEGSPANQAGLQEGDEIIRVDGKKFYSVMQLGEYLEELGTETAEVTVLREGKEKTLSITPGIASVTRPMLEWDLQTENGEFAITLVGIVDPEEANPTNPEAPLKAIYVYDSQSDDKASPPMQFYDKITELGGKPVESLSQFKEYIESHAGKKFTLTITRGDMPSKLVINGTSDLSITEPKTRVMFGFERASGKVVVTYPTPIEQFRSTIDRVVETLDALISRGSDVGLDDLAGAISITRYTYQLALSDIRLVLWMTVFLNINLAILNVLPFPVLDGGHMLVATIEKLRGKKIPVNILATVQSAFMIMLLTLMAYVLFFDTQRWRGDNERREELIIEARKAGLERITPVFHSTEDTDS